MKNLTLMICFTNYKSLIKRAPIRSNLHAAAVQDQVITCFWSPQTLIVHYYYRLKMASKRPSRSLIDMWAAAASSKRPALNNAIEADHTGSISSEDEGSPDLQSDLDTSEPVSDLISSDSASTSQSVCTLVCCSDEALKPFQPTSREILVSLTLNGRNFVAKWFEQYPWLTAKRKVFCFECRFASKHELLTFSHNCSPAFTNDGFNNWKKAIEKFNSHEASHTHREATMKRLALGQPTLHYRRSSIHKCAVHKKAGEKLCLLSCLRDTFYDRA